MDGTNEFKDLMTGVISLERLQYSLSLTCDPDTGMLTGLSI